MSADLQSLKVLVTRPLPQGKILCDALLQHGAEAIYFPTVQIDPPQDAATLPERLRDLSAYDALIFISPAAVMAFCNARANLPPVPAALTVRCGGWWDGGGVGERWIDRNGDAA